MASILLLYLDIEARAIENAIFHEYIIQNKGRYGTPDIAAGWNINSI